MKRYGKKKVGRSTAGHQDCGVCHPAQKNMKSRARADAKKVVNEAIGDDDLAAMDYAMYGCAACEIDGECELHRR